MKRPSARFISVVLLYLKRLAEVYEYNRRLPTTLYSDLMSYAPGVPVFRDDANELLPRPYQVAFITAPR